MSTQRSNSRWAYVYERLTKQRRIQFRPQGWGLMSHEARRKMAASLIRSARATLGLKLAVKIGKGGMRIENVGAERKP